MHNKKNELRITFLGFVIGGVVIGSFSLGTFFVHKKSLTDSSTTDNKIVSLNLSKIDSTSITGTHTPTLRSIKNISGTHIDPDKKPFEIPQKMVSPDIKKEFNLWEIKNLYNNSQISSPLEFISPVEILKTLHPGQQVSFELPFKGETLRATLKTLEVATTHTKIWRGVIGHENAGESFHLVRGRRDTHIIISLNDGNYSAIINNHTGKTQLMDESHTIRMAAPHNDAIPVSTLVYSKMPNL